MAGQNSPHSDLLRILQSTTSSIESHNEEWIPTSRENRELLAAAKGLVNALEPPDNALWRVVFAEEAHAALRTALRMQLFSTKECKNKHKTDGIIDIANLSLELSAGTQTVSRIMRALAAVDIFSPVPARSPNANDTGFKHTSISIKLAHPAYCSFVVGLDDALPRYMGELPAYLESIEYDDAIVGAQGKTLFNFVSRSDLRFFDWLQERPDELALFKKSMQDVNVLAGGRVVNTLLSVFPGDQHSIEGEENVLMVDVGGGRGDVMAKFREQRPGLRGKIVVQDLPAVVKGLQDSDDLTYMSHSIFDPQPVKGANTYHLRHVLHNHPDSACLEILRHIAEAMSPTSRILILETMLPASGESTMSSLMDLKMLMMGGIERTETDWRSLLGRAGLRVVNVVTGSRLKNDAGGVIEARLA